MWCRCGSSDKGSYVWHNYRPLSEKLEDIIESVVRLHTAPRLSVYRFTHVHVRCCVRAKKSFGRAIIICCTSQVQEYVDKESVVVAAAYSLHRFLELREAPVCRDQFLRLVLVLTHDDVPCFMPAASLSSHAVPASATGFPMIFNFATPNMLCTSGLPAREDSDTTTPCRRRCV